MLSISHEKPTVFLFPFHFSFVTYLAINYRVTNMKHTNTRSFQLKYLFINTCIHRIITCMSHFMHSVINNKRNLEKNTSFHISSTVHYLERLKWERIILYTRCHSSIQSLGLFFILITYTRYRKTWVIITGLKK